MTTLKVVLDLDFVGVEVSYDMEVDDDELEGLPEDPDDRVYELTQRFENEAWETIKNNLCWHVEEADE